MVAVAGGVVSELASAPEVSEETTTEEKLVRVVAVETVIVESPEVMVEGTEVVTMMGVGEHEMVMVVRIWW